MEDKKPLMLARNIPRIMAIILSIDFAGKILFAIFHEHNSNKFQLEYLVLALTIVMGLIMIFLRHSFCRWMLFIILIFFSVYVKEIMLPYIQSPLTIAVMKGDISNVKSILDTGVDIEEKNYALQAAVLNQHLDIAQLLLDKGADINAPYDDSETLLMRVVMESAWSNKFDVVRFLIDKGANINARDDYGNTALKSAYRNVKLRQLLIDKGADVSVVEKKLDSVGNNYAPSNKTFFSLLKSFPYGTDIKIVRSAVIREGYYVQGTSVVKDKNFIIFSSSACDWPSWSAYISYDKAVKTQPNPTGQTISGPIGLNICAKNGYFETLKAEFGNKNAQHWLACLYTQGTALDDEAGCEIADPNKSEALKWWRRLAEGGDERSQLFLGKIYSNVEALRQYDLGYSKEKDKVYDMELDYAEAYFWYGLAVASGDNDVIPLRDSVGKHLNADQKAAEDARIQESKPR